MATSEQNLVLIVFNMDSFYRFENNVIFVALLDGLNIWLDQTKNI